MASKEPALVEKIRAQMPEMNFSPYVQKGLPGVKLSPKINADNYDCLWDAGSGTAKGFNASLEYCKAHDHCWHLGCILPKLPAMSVRTGGGWFGPCCIPKGSEPPRNAPGVNGGVMSRASRLTATLGRAASTITPRRWYTAYCQALEGCSGP